MKLIPTKKQFNNWTLVAKMSYIGGIASVIGLAIYIIMLIIPFFPDGNNIDPERFSITIVKFGSSNNIDNFYCDILLKNEGKESVILSDLSLLFSHDKFRGGQMVYAEHKYFVVQSLSEISTRLIFGKGKEDLWIKIHLYSEVPFHLGLKFKYSIGTHFREYIYPISESFKVFPNLGGYSYMDGDKLPLKLQISPLEEISPKLLEYPFDIPAQE